MKTYQTVKMEADHRFRSYRNLLFIVSNEHFKNAYEGASDAEKSKVEFQLIQGDISAIKLFVKQNGGKETLSVLKEKARRAGILNWCRMNKFALAIALDDYERRPANQTVRDFKVPIIKPRPQSQPDGL